MWQKMQEMLLGISWCVDNCVESGDAQERMMRMLAIMRAEGWSADKKKPLHLALWLVAGEAWSLLWERIQFKTGVRPLTAPQLAHLEANLKCHWDAICEMFGLTEPVEKV